MWMQHTPPCHRQRNQLSRLATDFTL
jgi:hypothetical protein